MRNIKGLSLVVAAVAVAAFAAGCGSKKKKKGDAGDPGAGGGETAGEEVSADISVVTEGDGNGLALLAASASFGGAVKGCITGHSPTFTQDTPSVAVLVGDTGCYARLDTINVTFPDGSTSSYLPDAAYKFAAGSAIIAAPTASGPLMRISVTSQLPAAIALSPAPRVAITLSFVQSGGSQTANVRTASAGIDVDVNNVIPYQLASVDLTVDGDTGGGAFALNMNCYSVVGASGGCDGMTQNQLVASLKVDTYLSGLTPRDLTFDECTALANGAGKASPSSVHTKAENAAGLPNGGAKFSLVGPAPLCAVANSKLVVAAAHPSTGSCKWWRVAVECP